MTYCDTPPPYFYRNKMCLPAPCGYSLQTASCVFRPQSFNGSFCIQIANAQMPVLQISLQTDFLVQSIYKTASPIIEERSTYLLSVP